MNTVFDRLNRLALIAAFSLATTSLFATDYYVDYEGGNNSNPGTATSVPWKHSPGDTAATGIPGSKTLVPGDRVIFKGGVSYRGIIKSGFSGTKENPIQYVGNLWGSERAVMDGTDLLTTTWTRCATPADCRGNPNFANIWYTSIPVGISNSFPTLIYNRSNWVAFAQDPNPSKPIFFDMLPEWKSIGPTNAGPGYLVDPRYFTQADVNFWDEAYIIEWVSGNGLNIAPIKTYSPAERKITFEQGNLPPYTDRNTSYSVVNHPNHIDRPGEYAVSLKDNKMYMWPPTSVDPNSVQWSIARRANGFLNRDASYVRFSGFKCIGYYADRNNNSYGGAFVVSTANGLLSSGVSITDNEITMMRALNHSWVITAINGTNITVSGNSITDSLACGGIYATSPKTGSLLVSQNRIARTGGTAIYTPGAVNSLISSNIIEDVFGTHANGISVYTFATNVVIGWNFIKNVFTPITFEQSDSLTLVNNVVDAGGGDQRISEWGSMTTFVRLINNTFVNNSANQILQLGLSDTRYELINNIIDGGAPATNRNCLRVNNIYTGRAWTQAAMYGWTLGPSEMESTDTALFVNPANANYRLKSGSPAIGRGTNVSSFGVTNDVTGAIRMGPWDIGAYRAGTNLSTISAPSKLRVVGVDTIPGSFIQSVNGKTKANRFDGLIGMYFQVGQTDVIISSLGRYFLNGNSQSHEVILFDDSTVKVGSVIVNNSNPVASDGFVYSSLAQPVTLRAGQKYYLMSTEFAGGDFWFDYDTEVGTSSSFTSLAVAYGNFDRVQNSAGRSFGPLNFKFQK